MGASMGGPVAHGATATGPPGPAAHSGPRSAASSAAPPVESYAQEPSGPPGSSSYPGPGGADAGQTTAQWQGQGPPPTGASGGYVAPTHVSVEDDIAEEDDPDLDESALSGHELIVRELGATVIEEIDHE